MCDSSLESIQSERFICNNYCYISNVILKVRTAHSLLHSLVNQVPRKVPAVKDQTVGGRALPKAPHFRQ